MKLTSVCAVGSAAVLYGCSLSNVIEFAPKEYRFVSEGQGAHRTVVKKPADPEPIYRVEPLPISLSKDLADLTERPKRGIKLEFRVGKLLSRVFTVTEGDAPRGKAKYVTSALSMDSSGATAAAVGGGLVGLAVAGAVTDLGHGSYSLTIAVDIDGRRMLLTGSGSGSRSFDEVDAAQSAVENAVLALHRQVAALLEGYEPVSGVAPAREGGKGDESSGGDDHYPADSAVAPSDDVGGHELRP